MWMNFWMHSRKYPSWVDKSNGSVDLEIVDITNVSSNSGK